MQKIPDPALYNLRCSDCQAFLSCGPIIVTKSGGSFCGRCQNINPNFIRSIRYEKVAEHFVFPCRNWFRYCFQGDSFNNIRKHEKSCPYRGGCGTCCCHPCSILKSERKLNLHSRKLRFFSSKYLLKFFFQPQSGCLTLTRKC